MSKMSLINLDWGIGKEIYNQQQEKGWGKSIVEVLAQEIKKDFPDAQGFSARDLWRMRNLYVEYKDNLILPPLVAEISWTKNVVIMEKCIQPVVDKKTPHSTDGMCTFLSYYFTLFLKEGKIWIRLKLVNL